MLLIGARPSAFYPGSASQRSSCAHYHRRHLSRYDRGSEIGSSGSSALSAKNVLSSPFLILILPLSRPSLPSLTLPVPETGSYSRAPSQLNDTPVLVGLAFT